MPSGYTVKLHDGEEQSFQEFAMGCARAFGATILMRDEPADAVIPDEFPPSEWEREYLEKKHAELRRLLAMTGPEWVALEESDRVAENASRLAYIERARGIVARYEAMLTQVRAWQPPTSEHEEFRRFMIEQLESSIKFDGVDEEGELYRPVGARSVMAFRADMLRRAMERVQRAEVSWAEEQARAAGRTKWVRDLRASLEGRDGDARRVYVGRCRRRIPAQGQRD